MSREKNLSGLGGAFAEGDERVDAYPAVMYLEATALCNLKCPMCPTVMGLPRDPYRTKMFDLELLPKLEPALPFVTRCFLSGGGEPLLHPRFFDIVRALKKHDIELHFNSNATVIDEECARLVMETRVDTISFSVDGATPETYSKIRVGADLDRTMDNIKRLIELKKKMNRQKPYLNMQFTVMEMNKHELKQMAALAASLGINHLVIEPLTPVFCFDSEYKKYYEAHRVSTSEVIDSLREAQSMANEAGLVFSSHYLFAEDNPEPPRKCAQPWLTFGVRVDGRVFSCCGTIEPMGDLATQSFEEIWNGPKYKGLRRELASEKFPDYCSLCIAENRANHFNEELLLKK